MSRMSSNLATISKEIVQITNNSLLTKPACIEEVVLSTMMVVIHNVIQKLTVRAAFDWGSLKTYKLDLIKIGEERLSHELFGGHVTKEIVHSKYKVLVENLSGTNSHSLEVLDQYRICYSVPKLRKGQWFNELKIKGIELTDLGTGSSEIELLIGSNLAGKLLEY